MTAPTELPVQGAQDTCGVVLAAGAGSRAGGPKAVVTVGGSRLVDRAVRTLRDGGCSQVLAVVRAGVEVPGATCVVNPDPDRGMGSSLRLALEAAAGGTCSSVVVLLVDQPGLTPECVQRLTGTPPGDSPGVIFATFHGRRAHPVRIDRPLWGAVAQAAEGDSGARAFARAHPELVREVECDGFGDPTDLDTLDELRSWGRS